jgi:hypothetical protein
MLTKRIYNTCRLNGMPHVTILDNPQIDSYIYMNNVSCTILIQFLHNSNFFFFFFYDQPLDLFFYMWALNI